jgi:hypothetical protein
MVPPTASALNLRVVLRRRNEGAGGSATITAAPLEQSYAAGIDRRRQADNAQAPCSCATASGKIVANPATRTISTMAVIELVSTATWG